MEKDIEKSYYERVKNYIALRPESTKIQVSADTGIPIDFIEDGISEGKFEEHDGYLIVARRKGMTPLRRNELAQKFANGLHYEVEPLNAEKYKKPESQLVIDLRKRYGNYDNSKDDRSL